MYRRIAGAAFGFLREELSIAHGSLDMVERAASADTASRNIDQAKDALRVIDGLLPKIWLTHDQEEMILAEREDVARRLAVFTEH